MRLVADYVPPSAIGDTTVALTVASGQVVHGDVWRTAVNGSNGPFDMKGI
jgi:hypothetical protein